MYPSTASQLWRFVGQDAVFNCRFHNLISCGKREVKMKANFQKAMTLAAFTVSAVTLLGTSAVRRT